MSDFRIIPYKLGSESARLLAEGLEALRVNPKRNTYRRFGRHRLINWGCSQTHYEPFFEQGDFNHPRAVSLAADKRVTYQLLQANNVPTLEFTDNPVVAQEWCNGGYKVYGRDTATGHSGQGITVYPYGSNVARHLFYTKGVASKWEFRIHVGRDNRVIDITQKRRRNGHRDASLDIRSYNNGWVFCRNEIEQPPVVLMEAACDAIRALDLDFGAVDVCLEHSGKVTVFEVNTAPGIEGTTLNKYVEFFKNAR